MNTLTLRIKKRWFDMILSSEKLEEYREIKPYYDNLLLNKNYTHLNLVNGYNKNSPKILIEITEIKKDLPNKNWCDFKSKLVYVFCLGKILEQKNIKQKLPNIFE